MSLLYFLIWIKKLLELPFFSFLHENILSMQPWQLCMSIINSKHRMWNGCMFIWCVWSWLIELNSTIRGWLMTWDWMEVFNAGEKEKKAAISRAAPVIWSWIWLETWKLKSILSPADLAIGHPPNSTRFWTLILFIPRFFSFFQETKKMSECGWLWQIQNIPAPAQSLSPSPCHNQNNGKTDSWSLIQTTSCHRPLLGLGEEKVEINKQSVIFSVHLYECLS